MMPEDAEAHSTLGVALRRLGRLIDAADSHRQAISLAPGFAEAHNNLGNALRDLDRPEEAEACFRQAIALKPDYSEALHNLGNVLRDLGRSTEAETCFRQTIALQPDNAEAYNDLGGSLWALGRLGEAETAFRQAVALKPSHAEARSNLGNALREVGQLEEAEAQYRQAIVQKPGSAEAHSNLGLFLINSGRLNDARACLSSGLDKVVGKKWVVGSTALVNLWLMGMHREANVLANEFVAAASQETTKALRTHKIFLGYIAGLLAHFREHPELYQTNGDEASLVALGESHCLGLNGIRFNWVNDEPVVASCRFVSGIKMFHLANHAKKYYATVVSRHLSSIRTNSHLLFTIGEIDCRPDEGIWKAALKTGVPLNELVANTIDRYLDWLYKALGGRTFASITIQGVPAPNYISSQASVDGANQFLAMIQTVNQHLEASARARGWRFLDVYSATAGPDGRSNGHWHLDESHLQPKFYEQAGRWIRHL